MTRPGSARAPKGAAGGACRPSSRREGTRGPGWVRPYRRAQRALDSATSLLFSTMHAVMDAGSRAERRPIRTAQRLNGAVREMTVASLRLIDARRELAEASEALGREPEQQSGETPELMELAAARCRKVAEYIPIAVEKVVLAQVEILGASTRASSCRNGRPTPARASS